MCVIKLQSELSLRYSVSEWMNLSTTYSTSRTQVADALQIHVDWTSRREWVSLADTRWKEIHVHREPPKKHATKHLSISLLVQRRFQGVKRSSVRVLSQFFYDVCQWIFFWIDLYLAKMWTKLRWRVLWLTVHIFFTYNQVHVFYRIARNAAESCWCWCIYTGSLANYLHPDHAQHPSIF